MSVAESRAVLLPLLCKEGRGEVEQRGGILCLGVTLCEGRGARSAG